jgi:hypothetical protein
VDEAVRVGLALTGAAGILVISAPLGLFLTVVLVAMAPPARYTGTDRNPALVT